MLAKMTAKRLAVMMEDALKKEKELWRPLLLKDVVRPSGVGVSYSHRADIIEWMLAVCTQFRFYPEAHTLAVSIMDKFLTLMKIQHKYLKCIALTCINIAAKLTEEDEAVPHIADLVGLSCANCIIADVVRMEMIILNKLEWNVHLPTSLHFLQMCHAHLMIEYPDLLQPLRITPARHLTILTHRLQLCLMSRDVCSTPPSLLAASLLSLDLESFRPDWFSFNLNMLKFIKVQDLSSMISCRETLSIHLDLFKADVIKSHMSWHHKRRADSVSRCRTKRKVEELPDPEEIYDSLNNLYKDESMDVTTTPSDVIVSLGPED